jgi:endonuclease/exonuclease/phosphatase family metal-dependent hydrolase
VKVTAISIYGLMDEKSDASVHRSLSELSPIFDHKDYGKRLVLGGDLNILAGRPVGSHPDRHQVVLARIKAYGLIDCLEKLRPHGALAGCPCKLGDDCTHTWTKFDPQRPTVAYQDDYLFASRGLKLTTCRALPVTADSPSDHAPIVATFDI